MCIKSMHAVQGSAQALIPYCQFPDPDLSNVVGLQSGSQNHRSWKMSADEAEPTPEAVPEATPEVKEVKEAKEPKETK